MKQPWIKRALVALFGAGIVAGSVAACSSGPRGWHGSSGDGESGDRAAWQGMMLDRVAGRLELDAAQKQKLETLATRLREQRQALMGNGATPRAELQALVGGATFDKARAQALIDEKIAAVRSNSPAVLDAMADFYDGLNAAQQQQVRDFAERRRGWRRHG